MRLTDSIGGVTRCVLAGFDLRGGPKWRPSDPIASLPGKKNESCDQRNHDKHPVLTSETQKSKTLNEKLHYPVPFFISRLSVFFVQDKGFGQVNILFLYILGAGPPRFVNPCRGTQGAGGRCCYERLWRISRRQNAPPAAAEPGDSPHAKNASNYSRE